jgi:hypothetical protein
MRRALPWVGPAFAAAAVAVLQGGSGGNGDGSLFVGAGRTLLSADWSRAFSQPSVQAGPLQLVLYGSIGRSNVAVAVVIAMATAVLVVAAARGVGVRSLPLLTFLGFLAVVVGLTRQGYEYGHPADAILPLIWILAAAEARRDRVLLAGLLVGLSSGLETWGILGVAVLALAPRLRDAAIGVLAATVVVGALYLPFVLAGHFAMGSYRWQVTVGSAVSLVLPVGSGFGWPLRILQGALAVGAGVAAARLLRQSPHALWVVPLVVVAARLLLDPVLNTYYLAALQGPIFVGATLGAAGVIALRRVRRESYA